MSDGLREAIGGAVIESHGRVGRVVSPEHVNQVVEIVTALIPLISQFIAIFRKNPVSSS